MANIWKTNPFGLGMTKMAVVMVFIMVGCPKVRAHNDEESRFRYFFIQAVTERLKGNDAECMELMRHALAIEPRGEAWFNLYRCYSSIGDDAESLACLEKAVALNSNYKESLGLYYLRNGENKKAIDTFESIYGKIGDKEKILQILLRLYEAESDFDNMISTLNRLELLDGTSEEITFAKMQVFDNIGDKKKVRNLLEELSAKNPNDLNYKVMLGNWMMTNGAPDAAMEEFKQVLRTEPDNISARISMLDYYKVKGKQGEYEEKLEKLLVSEEVEEETRLSLINEIIQNNQKLREDTVKMMSLFAKMLEQPQKTSGIYMVKALYMGMMKLNKDSIDAAYEKSLAIEPDNELARSMLINSYWQKGDFSKVSEMCKQAQLYNPDEIGYDFYHALALLRLEKEDSVIIKALSKAEQKITAETDTTMATTIYSILGDVLYSDGQSKKAFECYDKALEWTKDEPQVLNNYAYYLCLDGGDLSKAEQMAFKAYKQDPVNPNVLDTYAWILFLQKRYEDARIYIDEALRCDSVPSSVVLQHAGDIYSKIGNMEKAMDYWQQAFALDSGDALLEKKIKLGKYIENE